MSGVCLIFPNQLFRDHPYITAGLPVVLTEEFLFFRQYRFHRAKLVLHRASMKAYEHWLTSQGIQVQYIESADERSDCRKLVDFLAKEGFAELFVADPADDWLSRRLAAGCKRHKIALYIGENPGFITPPKAAEGYFKDKKKYFQHDFYIWQRKSRKLLLDMDGAPMLGRWSFDAENRKRFPAGGVAPPFEMPPENSYISAAKRYVSANFPDAYGEADGPCLFGVTFEAADNWLDSFIRHRLEQFGPYEDAISGKHPFLFHSVISPMLNIGLLSPATVIRRVLDAGRGGNIPFSSLEGFVRQVVGWREFVNIVYQREGGYQRTRNFWGFSRKIPASFWRGDTGIQPVDTTIRKALRYGYCHHIERLMVLGNFMLLCEFDPDDVYRWFMELFIDAYDWVMVPNVYGMTQFADGGLMTTKPYISGSNYLRKMGDFKPGDWQSVWDGLFWRFLHVHRDFFATNPRLGMLLRTQDKMPMDKKMGHLAVADGFLAQLDKQI